MMGIADLQAEGLAQHIAVAGITVTRADASTVRIALVPVRDEPRGEFWEQGTYNANADKTWFWRSATKLTEGERVTTASGRVLIVTASKSIEFGDAVGFYTGTILETVGTLV